SIPRFCYHKKLSIAANCRMCMVEVEKAPKPLPSCATPVADGMKIFTQSEIARDAQKGTMEFLLINHPLDCPICDQGGECELQDVAVGYGGDVSRFSEAKRIVPDPDLGPLISTDMNRCIHCTRCVRFGAEIAGMRELGATGRGEFVRIGTFIEKSVDSELSGNVIDVCPVGALTAKPSRFKFRPWELVEKEAIAGHDCIGSNIAMHLNKGRIIRVVPRDNEAINECWISDRDRYSYSGIYSDDRIHQPMIKKSGQWETIAWDDALTEVNRRFQALDPDDIGGLLSPSATLEEIYLAQKYLRGLGVTSIDHRLRQNDFNGQDDAPVFPWLGIEINELEHQDAVLLIGANVRKDQPIAGLRLRKSVLNGGKVSSISTRDYEFTFDLDHQVIADPAGMVKALAAVANKVLAATKVKAPKGLQNILDQAVADDGTDQMAERLLAGDKSLIILGSSAVNHPVASTLSALASMIAKNTGSQLGYLPEGANAAGAWLAGALPHRGAANTKTETGLNTDSMLKKSCKAYFLLGLEPEKDLADPALAKKALSKADCVVVFSAYATDAMREYADMILPIGTFAETSGTFVNVAGHWQSFNAAIAPLGDAKPGWKVLRMLGSKAGLEDFNYMTSEAVREALKAQFSDTQEFDSLTAIHDGYRMPELAKGGVYKISETATYGGDAIVRRSPALQKTRDGQACAMMNPEDADAAGVLNEALIQVSQEEHSTNIGLLIDASIPSGCVYIPQGSDASSQLGKAYGPVTVTAVEVQ
ncbi:MAG TPA: NADH-quinone oxidoreductase subunit G, partial [Gammaproteobacteria bacterium]|nr:NADH-quinone oxidoreductase subunit G [Gammaproteobacteria bacterium]